MSDYQPDAGGDGGMKIGGMNIPKWAIYVGAGGLALLLLLGKKNSGATQQTDTGTSLLATEFDQRLREQWEAWQKWAEQYMNEKQGPVEGPHEPLPLKCPDGSTMFGGFCTKDKAPGVPSGPAVCLTMVNGECWTWENPPEPIDIETICGTGFHLDWNGVCVPDAADTYVSVGPDIQLSNVPGYSYGYMY